MKLQVCLGVLFWAANSYAPPLHEIEDFEPNLHSIVKVFEEKKICPEGASTASAFEFLKHLEKQSRIQRIILAHPKCAACDRMLSMWLSNALAQATSADEAVVKWRTIPRTTGRDLESFAIKQQEVLSLPDEEIRNLYNEVRRSVLRQESGIEKDLIARAQSDYVYHDQQAVNKLPRRSLAILKERKINISLRPEADEWVKRAAEVTPIPIFELLKKQRIVDINDFKGSKLSLAVHDIFDHFWFSALLEKKGFLDRYAGLLQRIGNPHLTDLFSREGEMIASIAFDFRSWQRGEVEYRPLFSADEIALIFKESKKAGTFSENQERAYEIITASNFQSVFQPPSIAYELWPQSLPYYRQPHYYYSSAWQRKYIPYIFSGIMIELLESTRKNGFIQNQDEHSCPTGIFNFFDPEYVALIVEGAHLAFNHDETLDVLRRATMTVELYLESKARNKNTPPLAVGLDDVTNEMAPQVFEMTAAKIKWMQKHPGFESVRYKVR